MGTGIALVTALQAKIPVLLLDRDEKQLQSAMQLAKKLLDKDVGKNKISADDAAQALSRMSTTKQVAEMGQVDFVIEAVSENFDLKKKIFVELSQVTQPHVILATNTSSISITKFQNDQITNRADKIIGMHFMNPVPVMKLVEVISGIRTSSQTLSTTLSLATAMGKVTTHSNDVAGFIANRLLMPYINEAVLALEQGVATRDDIDTTMKLGTNVPMGPLRLADFIGLDTCLAIMEVLHQDLGSKYQPAPLLRKYVDAGWLGNKTKRGFYDYREEAATKPSA